ncbi:helix-turn-helix domain-containing protein [Burkholderia sp. LMU1-1-1.1]|jgi:putative transcriptional regulator|uniref:helix-turn-helix domain-containing protein n=1 Tax=Burkholderia sp. LMU1-1-1.1 TaxID=3135266 RepID=UPI0028E3E29E|nr:helix-turn-helix domain-containing protein [uncultured Duganella sp.]
MDVQALIEAIEEMGRHLRGEIELETVEFIPEPINMAGLRASTGLSQSDFASRFGLSLRNIRRWESGEARPSFNEETLLWHIAQNPAYVEREFAEYCRSRSQVSRASHSI